MSQMQLLPVSLSPKDVVYTPDWVVRDMVAFFNPGGRILEPSKGDGAFLRHLPQNTEWCEIYENKDFFAYTNQVDWIIGNPPYSIFTKWLEHSFSVANEIVYLIPLSLFFRGIEKMETCMKYGWIKHIRYYGSGRMMGFETGNPFGAVQFSRNYYGSQTWSFYNAALLSNKACTRRGEGSASESLSTPAPRG